MRSVAHPRHSKSNQNHPTINDEHANQRPTHHDIISNMRDQKCGTKLNDSKTQTNTHRQHLEMFNP